jgi:hypothetical protein
MYANPQTATAATEALKAAGFDERETFLVAYGGGHGRESNSPDTNLDAVTADIMAAHVLKAHARIYAEGVSRGGSLVVVHAIFGQGALATRILDSFDPIDSGLAQPRETLRAWDEATPLSSMLGLDVLLDQPTPFSAFWNLPVLADKMEYISRTLHIPMLANHAASLSRTIGLPTLIRHSGSWSEKFGLPVLWRRRSART